MLVLDVTNDTRRGKQTFTYLPAADDDPPLPPEPPLLEPPELLLPPELPPLPPEPPDPPLPPDPPVDPPEPPDPLLLSQLSTTVSLVSIAYLCDAMRHTQSRNTSWPIQVLPSRWFLRRRFWCGSRSQGHAFLSCKEREKVRMMIEARRRGRSIAMKC